jgi:hypothetical protein
VIASSRLGGLSSPLTKAAIALVAVAILVARALLRGRLPTSRRITTGAMVVLALFGVGNYFGFSTRPLVGETEFSGYDLLHYYLNAKYFDELGYVHLYEAMVGADDELGDRYRRWRIRRIRDLDSSVTIPYAEVLKKGQRTKTLFSARRWRQFKHDFDYLQRTVGAGQQRQLFYDHGYNGTPFLQTIAGPLTNAVRVEDVKLLCHIETVLVLLLCVVMARMRGAYVAAVAV